MGSSTDAERMRRFEHLLRLLNERVQEREITAEQVESAADEAGLGIISAPEAWFHEIGRIGYTLAISLCHEHHESASVVYMRESNPGLSGPRYEWTMLVAPYIALAGTGAAE